MDKEFDVIIEIAQDSPLVKYEYEGQDPSDTISRLRVTRIVDTNLTYPTNYGFIPNTKAEDGDEVDAMVLTSFPLLPGCVIKCRALGVLNTTDQNGPDPKIFAIPVSEVISTLDVWETCDDLPKFVLNRIASFFEEYTTSVPDHWTKVEGWGDSVEAYKEIGAGRSRYNERFRWHHGQR